MLIHAFLVLMALLFSILRYIMVLFGVILFPLSIFCYLFPLTKRWGSIILNQILVFIFMPVPQVLCLRVAMLAFSEMEGFHSVLFNSIFALGMMLLFVLIPIFVLYSSMKFSIPILYVMNSPRRVYHTMITGVRDTHTPRDDSSQRGLDDYA